ncbi:MAG: hypothetical protein ACHP8A_15010 [Terriglobales bacterium]|nr:hypothetical protein [Terriglobales bacterium]
MIVSFPATRLIGDLRRFRKYVLKVILALVMTGATMLTAAVYGEEIPVRHPEGLVHGFLALSTLEGKLLAHGDLIQVTHGNQVTLHLRFDFKDGSVQDETTIYSQNGNFRVLSYHMIQKGPTFPHPTEVTVDCTTGNVTVRFKDDKGKEKTENQHLDLPSDLANAIVPELLKNVLPDSPRTTLSFLGTDPKPRLVKLVITSEGEDSFLIAGSSRKAIRYVVKVDIGGVAGVVAPLVGKKPADTHVWILGGEAPTFVKSEGPLYVGGPILRIELVSPVWPKHTGAGTKSER